MMMKKLNKGNVELYFFLDIHLFEFGISMDFLTNGVSIQRWKHTLCSQIMVFALWQLLAKKK